jgi:hypothetical protein
MGRGTHQVRQLPQLPCLLRPPHRGSELFFLRVLGRKRIIMYVPYFSIEKKAVFALFCFPKNILHHAPFSDSH